MYIYPPGLLQTVTAHRGKPTTQGQTREPQGQTHKPQGQIIRWIFNWQGQSQLLVAILLWRSRTPLFPTTGTYRENPDDKSIDDPSLHPLRHTRQGC